MPKLNEQDWVWLHSLAHHASIHYLMVDVALFIGLGVTGVYACIVQVARLDHAFRGCLCQAQSGDLRSAMRMCAAPDGLIDGPRV